MTMEKLCPNIARKIYAGYLLFNEKAGYDDKLTEVATKTNITDVLQSWHQDCKTC